MPGKIVAAVKKVVVGWARSIGDTVKRLVLIRKDLKPWSSMRRSFIVKP